MENLKINYKLRRILEPIAVWDDDGSNNDKAEVLLREFYFLLKKCKCDTVYHSGFCSEIDCHFSYMLHLIPAKKAFLDKLYCRAANELETAVRYAGRNLFQKRIMLNILGLLNEHLHIE